MNKAVILFILGLSIVFSSCSHESKLAPKAVNGVLDLRGWDFEKDGIVRLDGNWEFYWKKFLTSKNFDTVKTKHYIPVPKPWNGYKWGKEELGYEGYGTYRLRILVNDKTKDLGIKFPDQGTAFELYLNDSLVGKNGKIGKSRETSEPQYKPLLISFQKTSDTITLVCNVSNYDFHFGGIYFANLIGSEERIRTYQNKVKLSDYLISSSLVLLLFIFIIFYYFRLKDIISLTFAGFTLLGVIRTIIVNERIIYDFFPNLNWEWAIKLEAIAWMAAIPVGIFNVAYLFKNKINKKIIILFGIIYYSISLFTILTPSYINSQLIPIGQSFVIFTLVYFIYVFFKAIREKLEGSIIAFIGWVPFFLGGINEVLYYKNISDLYINYPLGCFIYCVAWIIILTRRFSLAFHRVENYAQDLKNEVDEKTKELREEKEKSEKLLLNVLPDQIAERLKQGEQPIADHFDEASVIFIDIVDFTKLSAKSTPNKIVNILNEVFTHFDKIAEKYGLEKIKTIGDCYMAAAGIPIHRADHAEAIASMAIESMQRMNGYITEDGHEIQFRVGLDCGPIVAGVIGKQKFIYDLWGDMVNTASRMETNGIIGRIQCTERFKDKLGKRSDELGIKFEDRGEIEVKGKGKMKTYFIN